MQGLGLRRRCEVVDGEGNDDDGSYGSDGQAGVRRRDVSCTRMTAVEREAVIASGTRNNEKASSAMMDESATTHSSALQS